MLQLRVQWKVLYMCQVNRLVSVFLLGDNIDTDNIAPGGYLHLPIEKQVEHCLESVINDFSGKVTGGDIIIAGENFGTGSSREQAPVLLRTIGIQAVFARSFSRLFFRNSINVGLYPGIYNGHVPFSNMENVEIDFEHCKIESKNGIILFEPPTGILKEILDSGGMVNYARKMIE